MSSTRLATIRATYTLCQWSVVATAFLLPLFANAQSSQLQVFEAVSADGGFGASVALTEERAAVGSSAGNVVATYQRDEGGPNAWGSSGILTAPCSNAGYGRTVAVAGDVLAVAAPFDTCAGSTTGAVYVYIAIPDAPSGWGLLQVLPSAADAIDGFGAEVAISDGQLAVRLSSSQPGAPNALVYQIDTTGVTWLLDSEVRDPALNNSLGSSLAFDGDRLAIGTPTQRRVSVFGRDNDPVGSWSLDTALFNDENGFGASVALKNDILVTSTQTGRIATLRFDEQNPNLWSPQSDYLINALNGLASLPLALGDGVLLIGDEFGDGSDALTGRVLQNEAMTDLSGNALFYEVDAATGDGAASNARFGASVAVAGRFALIGAPEQQGNGAAYLYELQRPEGLCDLTSSGDIDFGPTGIGQPGLRELIIQNLSPAGCIINTVSITGNLFALAQQAPSLPLTLAPGANTILPLRYAPIVPGPSSATLTLDSNDPRESGLALSGSGAFINCTLDALASDPDFERVPVGDTLTRTVALSNRGVTPCIVTGVDLAGSGAFSIDGPPTPFAVIVGEAPVTLDVSYSPTATGSDNAVLAFTDDAGELLQSLPIEASAVARCELAVSEAKVMFGTTQVGFDRVVTVSIDRTTNPAAASTCVVNTMIVGDAFSIESPLSDVALAGGETATLAIRFSPTEDTSYAGEVLIQTDDAAVDPIAIMLSGDAVFDADADGVLDSVDNCTLSTNPSQLDSNGDGFGNACDQDLNNDCVVNFTDLGIFRTLFFGMNNDGDFNGDGITATIDLGLLRLGFFGTPGPSALASCTTP